MFTSFLTKLRVGENLTEVEASEVIEAVFCGEADTVQLEELLVLLAEKGETVDEIVGAAKTMRQHATKIAPRVKQLVDVVGTGGDCANTFNISTTTAFVVAGAGVAVAKHGNRAVSSKSGAADVLDALGIQIDLSPEKISTAIEKIGIGFLFAPTFHPAMKFAAPIRAKLKRRTIFNLLGPLTNPAGAQHLLVGVFAVELVPIFAEVLQKMNHAHAIVIHGNGLDELTIAGENIALELQNDVISELKINLAELGIEKAAREDLIGGDAIQNAKITQAILNGEKGPHREIVILNSAAALFAADCAKNLSDAVVIARRSIDSGAAGAKLKELAEFTQNC